VAWRQPGQLYRALREAKGLTGAQVAAELGVSQSAVSQLETGKRRVPPSDNPDHEGRSWASRELWDELLALGEPANGEREPLYAVGILGGAALPRLAELLVVHEDRAQADAAAEKLRAEGAGDVAVVPLWRSWLADISA